MTTRTKSYNPYCLFVDVLTTANTTGYTYIPIKSNDLRVGRGDILAYVYDSSEGYGELLVTKDATYKAYFKEGHAFFPGDYIYPVVQDKDMTDKKFNIAVVLSKRALVEVVLSLSEVGDIVFNIMNNDTALIANNAMPIMPVQVFKLLVDI